MLFFLLQRTYTRWKEYRTRSKSCNKASVKESRKLFIFCSYSGAYQMDNLYTPSCYVILQSDNQIYKLNTPSCYVLLQSAYKIDSHYQPLCSVLEIL